MKLLIKMIVILLSLALLGAIFAGSYYLFKHVTDLYTKLEVQIGPVVGFASLVILLSALSLASGMRDARRRTIEEQLVHDKAALYERIVHEWADALGRGSEGLDLGDPVQDLERSLALRAGPAVLKAYFVLKYIQKSYGAAGADVRPQLAKVLIEMRKDLGLTLNGIEGEDITGLLLGPLEERHTRSTREQLVDNNIAVSV